jgi:hypothetical protein
MRRVFLPIILTALGAMLLIGCFYIPVVPHPTDLHNFGKIFEEVGDRGSKQPLRIGDATRAQVLLAAKEPPMMASPDGKSLVYSTPGVKGYWIWPLCFYAGPEEEGFHMRLNFDDAGVLRSYKVRHGGESLQEIQAGMLWPYDFESRSRRSPWPPALPTTRNSDRP